MVKNQINVASVQFDPHILEKEYNLNKIEELTRKAITDHNCDLIVFPEAAITGYGFRSIEEARQVAVEKDGPELQRLHRLASEKMVSLVVGTVEKEDDHIYNTVFFLEPDGTVFFYRKSHLPFLGVDRFTEAGDCAAGVFDTRFGKIGIMICYELRFPESARVAALNGVRLILQPTNLPRGGESHPDFLIKARACENRVYFISCNRCGTERGFFFIGRSQIIDYDGNVLAECTSEEEIISASINLTPCENKDIISAPGERELYLFRHRRWDLYKKLAQEPDEHGFILSD
ncbi:MAG: Nitrilase/cyanide hydratase and apolipoprotein N-acyltransferase [Evtepia sp.]|nr:Nitrilase/cyanide hydratase and apolipoprotein N-acyltransferase [Evtepia sp.]